MSRADAAKTTATMSVRHPGGDIAMFGLTPHIAAPRPKAQQEDDDEGPKKQVTQQQQQQQQQKKKDKKAKGKKGVFVFILMP
jgi:hypothetical protein